MIVRISGTGQFDVPDDDLPKLRELDRALTEAIHSHDETSFHAHLEEMIQFVRERGSKVGHDRVLPSQVIIPPDDISIDEAQRFFTDEGLMEPVPA